MEYRVETTYGYGNAQALKIASDISSLDLSDAEDILFDFTKYSENNPFSNLLIANSIRTFRKNHKNKCQLKPNGASYLSHLGFYQMIGADYGKQLGEARASDNYVPITKVTFNGDFYQTIEDKSEKLAALLKFDKELSLFLKYLFIETIRNTYEHADIGHIHIRTKKNLSNYLVSPVFHLAQIIATLKKTTYGETLDMVYISCVSWLLHMVEAS